MCGRYFVLWSLLVIMTIGSLCSTINADSSPYKITGQVFGANGQAPISSHVQITALGETYLHSIPAVQTDLQGKFQVEAAKPGLYRLWISAVNHQQTFVPLFFHERDKEIRLTITLNALSYRQPLGEVKITGSWNGFNTRNAGVMQKQEDGTYVYEAESNASPISYQLLGAVPDQMVNGTMADSYEYANNGSYRSVLKVKPGKIKIIFDPLKLKASSAKDLPQVTFDTKHKGLEKTFTMSGRLNRLYGEYRRASAAYRKTHDSIKGFTFSDSGFQADLYKIVNDDKNEPLVRQFGAIIAVQLLKMNIKLQQFTPDQILKTVPPESELWGYDSSGIIMLSYLLPKEKAESLIKEFYEKNPDRRVRARTLASILAAAAGRSDGDRVQTLYAELKDKFGDVREIQYELTALNPDKRIDKGRPVPDFEVKLLGSGDVVTNKSLLGKYYLIDFWATWCGGCNDEMPFLHKAYEQLKDDDFQILSLAVDEDPEAVKKFHQTWPMPWLNAVVDGGMAGRLARDFEVKRLPRPILVGPDGFIITVDNLRGDGLQRTLEAIFSGKE